MSPARSGALVRNELRLLRADPSFFIINTVSPLVVMAFLKSSFRATLAAEGHPGVNGSEQAVPGMAVMFALFLMGSVGIRFFQEHSWGTWDRLRASRASTLELMVGKVTVPLLQVTIQLTVLFVAGGLLYDLHVAGSVLALALVAGGFCLCVVTLGLLFVVLSRTVDQLNAFSNLSAFVMAGIGGALAPIAALPDWARAVAPAAPTYWAMRGFRDVILDGAGVGDVIGGTAVLLTFALVFGVVFVVRYRVDQPKIY